MQSNYINNDNKDISLTPLELINSLGDFDLDPCGLDTHRTAKEIFMLPTNGLIETWDKNKRIWLNPPFSQPSKWVEKLSIHGNGICLTLASTGTKWFQDFLF